MDWYRARHTIGLMSKLTGFARANYIRRYSIFKHVGENCMFMFRKVPLYPKLISIGNNVHIASNVYFITHDVTHNMLNKKENGTRFSEYVGPIEIGDNVFVGSNTTILYNSRIPANTIIGSNSLVNTKLCMEGVYAGIPVHYICSLEEFIKKREQHVIDVKKRNGNLCDETVELCWEMFKD